MYIEKRWPGKTPRGARVLRPTGPSRQPAPRGARGGGAPRSAPKRQCDVLVDAHCHLGDAAFDPDRDAVITRARDAGVGHVVVIGATLLAESERALALTRTRPGLSATAGVHPMKRDTGRLPPPPA